MVLNFGVNTVELDPAGLGGIEGYRLILGNYGADREDSGGKLILRGYEGRVYIK